MATKWQIRPFGNCAELVRETGLPPFSHDVPYIGLEHIGGNTLSLTNHGVGSDVTSTKTIFSRGDILFGKLRPYFRKVIRAPFDGICSTDIWVVQATKGIDQRFLYYCMASQPFVDFVTSGSEGTRMPRAKWEYASQFKFALPSLPEQRAIAHILGTLDDKIELNRRMNETVETMTHTLFKSWFVDFDPVRAKMEGRDTGLPPDVAALFPDRLVYSELGEIPEEWIAENLGSYVEFQNGYAFKSVDWQNKGVPVVKIGSVKPGLVDLTAASCVSPETVVDLERFKLNPGDILVGMTGYPGETGLVPIHDPPPYLNQRVGRISAPQDSPENYAWIYAQVRSQSFKRHAEARAHGSAQANVSGRALLEYPVVSPGKELLKTYSDFATPLISRYLANDTVSRTLATLRDTLLSKLISGDLRVKPGAQIAMEPAA